ncbi:MAG TPA: MBL fold metallo-hydrolase [Gemmatimonadaceae bacterium]
MKVEILGARGNIPLRAPRYTRHSGVLIDGTILLDLGEPSYVRRRPRWIFITHLHPDHAALGAASVITSEARDSLFATGEKDHVSAALYLPERSRLAPAARVIRQPVRVGVHRVIPVPTQHAVNARSVGYIVERGSRRIFYSSDLFAIHRRYYPRLGRLDLVITDGSFMRRGGLVRVDPKTGKRFGHAGIPDLVDLFSRFTRRIVFTHFGSWFYADIAESIRRIEALGNGVKVGAARDGLVIRV